MLQKWVELIISGRALVSTARCLRAATRAWLGRISKTMPKKKTDGKPSKKKQKKKSRKESTEEDDAFHFEAHKASDNFVLPV